MPLRIPLRGLMLAVLTAGLALASLRASAESATQLDRQAQQTLGKLYQDNITARQLGQRAKAELVFPEITKAGVGIGGSYGEGVLLVNKRPVGYYSVGAGSLGVTLGAAQFSEVILFMTDGALEQFRASNGWEAGVDGQVVAIKEGSGASYDTTNAPAPVVGFIFGQTGLLVDASFEGAKYSKIAPPTM